MLNPSSKTFSIRRLQSLCKSNPSAAGISFIPPSTPRTPLASAAAARAPVQQSRSMIGSVSAGRSTSSGWAVMGK